MPRDKFSLVVCQVEFRLHAPFCNLFDRLAGGEFFLHAPCWNLFVGLGVSLLFVPYWNLSGLRLLRSMGSFSYTPRAGIHLVVWRVGSLSYTPRAGICSSG